MACHPLDLTFSESIAMVGSSHLHARHYLKQENINLIMISIPYYLVQEALHE